MAISYIMTSKEHFSYRIGILLTLCFFTGISLTTHAQQCLPISTLNCSNLKVNTPIHFNFNGSDGGLTDKNGVGTGFTMVDNPSTPLATPTNSHVPGFEPSKLEINGGKLTILTTAGLAFRSPSTSTNTNSQVNALGVGVNASQTLTIQTTLLQPSAGTGKYEQAGLWFGLDEDNYIKFDVVSAGSGKSQIELLKEVGATVDDGQTYKTTALTLATSTVKLLLVINNATKTVEGRYTINGGSEVVLGSISIPDSFITGKSIGSGITSSFAGIYTSHRNATTPISFNFEDFKVESETTTTTTTTPSSDFSVINWTTVAPQQYVVNEAQGKVVNGKLYTFGGFDSQKSTFTPTKRAYVYDPGTNSWATIADLPHTPTGAGYGGVTHAGIATDGTNIFFAGGYTSNSSGTGQIFGTKQVWRYNVAQNTYTKLPDLPIDISAGQLEYLNGKLHHIGGTNLARTQDLGNHYELDLNNLTGGWKSLALLPTPRHHAGSAVFDNKIYFIGGQHGHDGSLMTIKAVHAYNPTTNSWTQVADMPTPSGTNGRGHISSSVIVTGNRILVLGGETVHNTGRTNMVSAYTPSTNSWTNLTALPQSRFSGVAGVLNGNIYYTGGSGTKATFKGVPENNNEPPPVTKALSFSPISLDYSVEQGGSTPNQSATLSANEGTPAITLAKSINSNWLVLPASPGLGSLSFGVNASGLLPGTYNTTVTASSTGYTNATLQVKLVVTETSADPKLSFSQSSQNVEVVQGKSHSLLEYLSTSNNAVISATLQAVDEMGKVPSWLSVNGNPINSTPYTTGSEISFTINAASLAIGTYTAVVIASSNGYEDGVLEVKLTVKSEPGGTLTSAKINFQDETTVPPTGWLRDYGQSFGSRTSSNQGSGHFYGWKKRFDNMPVDLTSYGRKRSSPSDLLLSTLMHMQVNDEIGNLIEGIWEIKVENGNYDVSISVGDGQYYDSKHFINIEGVNVISNFVPTQTIKFKSVTATVSVADGNLTVDPIGGTNTKINSIIIQPSSSNRPSVVAVKPEDGTRNVDDNASISTSVLKLPNGGINNATITTSTVYLTEENTGAKIPSNVNGTGGGDAITLVPSSRLNLNTTYRFTITDGVKDLSGASFIPYSSTFTTGEGSPSEVVSAKFDKVPLANTIGRHSTLTMGPDGKLYATTIDGLIKRFPVNPDGTLGTPEIIYSLQDAYGARQARLLIGFTFDPSSTASNLIAWVSHSSFVFQNGPDWDGKLTKLSGNNLQTVQDVIVNLPRSTKDHLTNSIAFGPDNALYFTQGSVSAMGKEDKTWGLRPERLLSAAVLRLDVSKLGSLPLNARTSEGGGTYNPYAANAPLTIYASGTRNAYDLVWHSNGKLYVPTNGSAAGGNTPASVNGTLRPDGTTYSGPTIPSVTNVQQTQKDFLFNVVKGGYYGHPNPLRGEYVMNGGNPTTSIDPAQVDDYPEGTAPDSNWRGYAFDFENNKSPNGIIEYKSNAFDGSLKGKLLVVRYSQNDDIIVLSPGGSNLDIVSSVEGASIPGFSGFVDPLDLTEDEKTGNIYVSEYGGEGRITLLRPNGHIPSETTSVTLNPIADSYTRNGSFAGNNYGNEKSLIVKGTTGVGYVRQSYLKFSLSEVSSVTKATLRIYGGNKENNLILKIATFGIDDDSWTETGINWNNAPSASTSALATNDVGEVAQYYEFDITPYVAAQLSGDKIVSLLLTNPTNQNKMAGFNSKENDANKPELIIETTSGNTGPGVISVNPVNVYDNDVSGGTSGINRPVTIKNTGSGNLIISEVNLTGTHSNEFIINALPALPTTIASGSSLIFNIAFNPGSTGLKTASVIIKNNDTARPNMTIPLRALGTSGLGGSNEPSLQSILNLLEIPVNVGDDDASTNVIHSSSATQKAPILGEELSIQKFVKAGTGNVTIEPLAVFGPTDNNPVLGMGWYTSGVVNSRKELFTVSNNPLTNGQTVNVSLTGVTSFDPSTASFGFFSRWPFFNDRYIYSEDNLNTFSGSIPHHVRVYPFKNSSGVVPNAYIITFEEHTSGFDYQDIVFVVKNVKPAATDNQPTLVTLNPMADSHIQDGSSSGVNFGNNSIMIVKGTTVQGYTRKAYYKFSLANINSVGTAKLRVYGSNQDETNVSVLSYGVDDDSWSETTITWENAPEPSTVALSNTSVNNEAKYYELDVTTYLKNQVSGDKMVTLVLANTSNQDKMLKFNSKENTDNKPELIIDTSGGATGPDPTDPNTGILVENLDKFPSDDDLVFSRIQIPWSRDGVVYNANHDLVTMRIQNKGTSTLKISALTISNPAYWQIVKLGDATYSASSLPLNIEAGKFADITLKFIAKDLNTRVKILRETVTIASNDAKTPNKVVRLNGLWQYKGEGRNEPFAQEIIDVFGFKTKTGFSRNDPDKGDPAKLKGDEILSFHFKRADNTKPVYVRQLASYHGCCNATERFMWHVKGSNTLNTVFTHIALDGQSLLPRKNASTNTAAEGTFSPTGSFGFKIGGKDWTDATKTPSNLVGVRVWKAIDGNGKVIKDVYIVANDYLGTEFTNYDYNDNLYYVTNIKPDIEPYALKSNPSAVDFGEKLTNSSSSLSFSLSNLGVVYADGSSDPGFQISSVEVVGPQKGEFSTALPVKTTINPQESTNFNVTFKPISQGLKIADLLIHHNGAQSPHRVPLYGIAKNNGVTVTAHYRINSGSSTAVTIGGKVWAADNQFAYDNLEPYSNRYLSQIAATDEDAIYLTEQSSNGDKLPFRYEIPVSNDNYVVRLHFAEIYWGALGGGTSGGVGSRVMGVAIEGQTLLSQFDVVKEVGKATAVIKNFPVSVTDGKLNINFNASVNRPMVCAVEVYSFSSPTSTNIASAAKSKEDVIELETGGTLRVYPNPLSDKFTIHFPEDYEGDFSAHLIDQYGKVMELARPTLEKGGSKMEIDLKDQNLNLSSGIYFLRIHSDTRKTENIKLIIK